MSKNGQDSGIIRKSATLPSLVQRWLWSNIIRHQLASYLYIPSSNIFHGSSLIRSFNYGSAYYTENLTSTKWREKLTTTLRPQVMIIVQTSLETFRLEKVARIDSLNHLVTHSIALHTFSVYQRHVLMFFTSQKAQRHFVAFVPGNIECCLSPRSHSMTVVWLRPCNYCWACRCNPWLSPKKQYFSFTVLRFHYLQSISKRKLHPVRDVLNCFAVLCRLWYFPGANPSAPFRFSFISSSSRLSSLAIESACISGIWLQRIRLVPVVAKLHQNPQIVEISVRVLPTSRKRLFLHLQRARFYWLCLCRLLR